jgi:hypothetical protein
MAAESRRNRVHDAQLVARWLANCAGGRKRRSGARALDRRAGFGGAGFGDVSVRRQAAPTGTESDESFASAMKQEVDAYFDYIVREDHSVLELLQSNYTFVNDPARGGLWSHQHHRPGDAARRTAARPRPRRRVDDGRRPDRDLRIPRHASETAGKWILETSSGSPPAPPPPNVPAPGRLAGEDRLKAPTQARTAGPAPRGSKCALVCHADGSTGLPWKASTLWPRADE